MSYQKLGAWDRLFSTCAHSLPKEPLLRALALCSNGNGLHQAAYGLAAADAVPPPTPPGRPTQVSADPDGLFAQGASGAVPHTDNFNALQTRHEPPEKGVMNPGYCDAVAETEPRYGDKCKSCEGDPTCVVIFEKNFFKLRDSWVDEVPPFFH